MMTLNVEHIFHAARDFQTGSEILADRFGQAVFPLRSTVVTAAFSVELYLKCLLLLTAGSIPRSHKLVDLHDALPSDTKGLVKAKYVEVAPDSGELRDILLEHNATFVEWRYLFEKQSGSFTLNYQPLRNVGIAFYEAVISLRPDWKK